MTKRRVLVAVLSLVWCAGATAQPTHPHPAHRGKVVLFGNLHAHSKLSDDVSHHGPDMTPAAAFAHAHAHGLDFLAITDHHKATDSGHRLWMTQQEYKSQLFDVAMDYNQQHSGAFIAIPAIEWGNTATGNHVNCFGAATLPPDTILDADYDELYEWAKANCQFVQFNHPNSWKGETHRNRSVGNFGEALYASQTAFAQAIDPIVELISIICTVKGGHISGELKDSEDKTHREMQWENYYRQYLNMGMHISPGGDQDTHSPNFGTVTAARTAVWANSASYDDLMAAIKANCVYATEDDELVVSYQVRYLGQTYWMGQSVPIQGDEADVELVVRVWQGVGTDGDSIDEGPYTVDVLSDSDGIGGSEAAVWKRTQHLPSGVDGVIPLKVVPGEYIYIQVTEEGGKDNPIGDGEDEVVNATGDHGSDDLRDDMNDSAWTSPIWFVAAGGGTQTFVWSVNRPIYHDLDCPSAKSIGAANRRTGPPPAGKTKHACHP